MGKYLLEVRYTAEGAKGIAKEGGTARRKVVEKLLEGVGGKLEAFYFAFGDADAYTILDLPDHVSAAAAALAVNQSGAATIKTTVLITPDEMDKAAKTSVAYRAPGK